MTPKSLLSNPMFKGSIAALVTPFTAQGEVDFDALDVLVGFHLENATDGLVIAGTTGESPALSRAEFAAMLRRVVTKANGRIPIIAGTGSASTKATIEQTAVAAEQGANGVLIVTPYYVRPPQSGLQAHFTAVADASVLPVFLYNVPSRTGVDLLPSTVEVLSAHDRIVGVKEAVPDPARIEELCTRCGPDFTVLSGDDGSCMESILLGASGVISVAANVAPRQMHDLCMAAAGHERQRAESLNLRLKPLFDVLMIETNPIPVKWALFEMGLIGSTVRLPLTRLGERLCEPVRKCLAELQNPIV